MICILRSSLLSLLLSFAVIGLPLANAADTAPADLLSQIITKAKSEHSMESLVDYLDYRPDYEKLPTQLRSEFNIHSAADVAALHRRLLHDPTLLRTDQMIKRFYGFSSGQVKDQVARNLPDIEDSFVNIFLEQRQEFLNSDYLVSKSQVEGTHATVELVVSAHGRSRTEEIEMINVEGRWLVATPDFLFRIANPFQADLDSDDDEEDPQVEELPLIDGEPAETSRSL